MKSLFSFVNIVVGGEKAEQTTPEELLPWYDYQEQSKSLNIKGDLSGELKSEILEISLDESSFLVFTKSQDSDLYEFDLEGKVQSILLLLEEDPNLKDKFRRLVPGATTEELFWKSYFYTTEKVKASILQKFAGKHVETRKINDFHEQLLYELDNELKAEQGAPPRQNDSLARQLEAAVARISQLEERVWSLEQKSKEDTLEIISNEES